MKGLHRKKSDEPDLINHIEGATGFPAIPFIGWNFLLKQWKNFPLLAEKKIEEKVVWKKNKSSCYGNIIQISISSLFPSSLFISDLIHRHLTI
jgi:hypothetical protein